MLVVSARELRDPVVRSVQMKTDNGLVHMSDNLSDPP
jgi:hypothetical protein